MRYELRPQRHSPDYPYDGGWATWDTAENVQLGWFASKSRAVERIEELNSEASTAKATGLVPLAPIVAQ
jgi:hypothetical protein